MLIFRRANPEWKNDTDMDHQRRSRISTTTMPENANTTSAVEIKSPIASNIVCLISHHNLQEKHLPLNEHRTNRGRNKVRGPSLFLSQEHACDENDRYPNKKQKPGSAVLLGRWVLPRRLHSGNSYTHVLRKYSRLHKVPANRVAAV